MIAFIEGGLKWGASAGRFVSTTLDPGLKAVRESSRRCTPVKAATSFFTGLNTQSVTYDRTYPRQSTPNSLRFNAAVGAHLNRTAPDVRAIDFMNLTENAQLSDGVHYRTDVNMAKAHVVLRLMELVAEEGVAKLRAEEGPPRAWPTLTDGCDAQDRALGRCGGLDRR